MAFERGYVWHSFAFGGYPDVNTGINEAVAALDQPGAAASVACMSVANNEVHILIEYWRADGDSQQDTTPALDGTAKARKPRRKSSSHDDNAPATERVEPASIDLPLESPEVASPDPHPLRT